MNEVTNRPSTSSLKASADTSDQRRVDGAMEMLAEASAIASLHGVTLKTNRAAVAIRRSGRGKRAQKSERIRKPNPVPGIKPSKVTFLWYLGRFHLAEWWPTTETLTFGPRSLKAESLLHATRIVVSGLQ